MGTKRRIAGPVSEVIAHARRGPFLDLFAGVSAVGSAVAPSRNVWCNDVQHFAHTLATSIFLSREGPDFSAGIVGDVKTLARINRKKLLSSDLSVLVREEDRVLARNDFMQGVRFYDKLVTLCASEASSRIRRMHRRTLLPRPYRLFAITYAGGYIGIKQAIEIDSLRYALDTLFADQTLNVEQHRWSLLALCKALANVSNSTGHFAQYLTPKESTYHRFLAKRRRNIFSEWRFALDQMEPEGTATWRKRNRTFRAEAMHLLQEFSHSKTRPSVVYADPPYTRDHYSRYYHLFDTLLLYDYPDPVGKGQYRSNRFASEFSMRSKVYSAFHELVSRTARLDSDLIINYPETGLLEDPKSTLLPILRQYFRRAEVALAISHEHSSLGASKGSEKLPVTELVFYAR